MPDWQAIRREFPALAGRTYLNTATYGQTPRVATEALMAHFARRDEQACADFLDWFEDLDKIRGDVARLVNAEVADIAFVPNASTALGWLMSGLDWRHGDRVVTLAGEFPNNLYAPAHLQRLGVEFVETPWARLRETVESGRTRLVLVSSVNYSTGFRVPLEDLAPWLRRRGVLLYVDGTQSVGALRFDCASLQPDMLAVHGYKWLLSPNGAGFAYVHPDLRNQLPPTVVGWRSDQGWREVDHLHHGSPRFSADAVRYEGGMPNFPSLYAMGASVRMFLDIGLAEIENRVLRLAADCATVLERAGASIHHRGSGIVAGVLPGVDHSALARTLREQRIHVSARHGALRVSVHFYNDEGDLQTLAEALRS